jgi:hypothetical protein
VVWAVRWQVGYGNRIACEGAGQACRGKSGRANEAGEGRWATGTCGWLQKSTPSSCIAQTPNKEV